MNMIRDDSNISIIGMRNTGKSFLIRDIFFNHQDIPVGTIISPLENSNKIYGDIVPPIFIHDEYSSEVTYKFMKRQKKMRKRIVEGEKELDNRSFLVLDDCLYDKAWQKDKNIREIFMNGRTWGCFFILTMSYPLGIPPNLRANLDFIFIFKDDVISNRKKLYENYAGMFPTFEMFCQTLNSLNEYECLVIHNCSPSPKLEDQVFWYKAEEHNNFKLCSCDAWLFSEKYYIDEKEKENENENKNENENENENINEEIRK